MVLTDDYRHEFTNMIWGLRNVMAMLRNEITVVIKEIFGRFRDSFGLKNGMIYMSIGLCLIS